VASGPAPEPALDRQAVKDGFDLSEASNTPVMLMVRIRSCHVTGSFTCSRQQAPKLTVREALSNPRSDFNRVVLPPMSYAHEQDKVKNRWPAAKSSSAKRPERGLRPRDGKLGIIVQGGMYNGLIRALQRLGLADIYGATDVPIYVLNVTYPLIEASEFLDFCRRQGRPSGDRGRPARIHRNPAGQLPLPRRVRCQAARQGPVPMAGEYTGAVMLDAVEGFMKQAAPGMLPAAIRAPNVDRPAIPT
jgi:indolepyruvate ferredoxin oxidoreductase alpha subunit